MGFPWVEAIEGNAMANDNCFGGHGGKDAGYLNANDLKIFLAVAQTRQWGRRKSVRAYA
jgi:hypothetical protein